MARRLNDEVQKFNQLQKLIGGKGPVKELTTQDYIEYVLNNGSNQEKSCLLRFIEGKLLLKDGMVHLSDNICKIMQ